MMKRSVEIFPDLESLSRAAARAFVETAAEAVADRGRFSVALAGGSTPRKLYRLLAGEEFSGRVDWSRTDFFLGDERLVPPGDEESNYRMARENLFDPLGIDDGNVYRWRTETNDAVKIAAEYAQAIREAFALGEHESFPRFDLILLGMGADGHTASLFPETGALAETEKIAAANPVPQLDSTRLTLTYPIVNNARRVVFLVAGEDKANALREVFEGRPDPTRLPAQAVAPADGGLLWLIDETAAARLRR